MTTEPPKNPLLILLMIALLGGIAKQAQLRLAGKKLTWKHFFFRALVSLFIGVLCYYILPWSAWSTGLCGLLSWLGADGVTFLLDLVVRSRGERQ